MNSASNFRLLLHPQRFLALQASLDLLESFVCDLDQRMGGLHLVSLPFRNFCHALFCLFVFQQLEMGHSHHPQRFDTCLVFGTKPRGLGSIQATKDLEGLYVVALLNLGAAHVVHAAQHSLVIHAKDGSLHETRFLKDKIGQIVVSILQMHLSHIGKYRRGKIYDRLSSNGAIQPWALDFQSRSEEFQRPGIVLKVISGNSNAVEDFGPRGVHGFVKCECCLKGLEGLRH
mmetsp:Transcript_182/g.390  ORF Transcript_182/g.390 Transcript_182/m.390 type:complete len:230 (+) Transcript_182:88-777(+)